MTIKLHPGAKTTGKIETKDKKVTTVIGRLSFPYLFEKSEYNGNSRWQASLIIPKDVDISALKVAAHNAAIELWGSDTSKWPSKKVKTKSGKVIDKCIINMPFQDGDMKHPDKPEYENTIFINASNKKRQPPVLGPKLNALGEDDIKAGDYVKFSLLAFAYPHPKSKNKGNSANMGVSFTLMGVQLIRLGEALGGGGNVANDFNEEEEIDYSQTPPEWGSDDSDNDEYAE